MLKKVPSYESPGHGSMFISGLDKLQKVASLQFMTWLGVVHDMDEFIDLVCVDTTS